MKRSEEYWKRLNVDLLAAKQNRIVIRRVLADAQMDIAELYKMIEEKRENLK